MSPDNPFGFGDMPAGFPDPNDPRLQQMMAQLRQFMTQSQSSGPVNWDLAKQLARQSVGKDPSVGDAARAETTEALRLADLWLEDASTFPSGVTAAEAWSRSEWIENTGETWKALAEPLAAKMSQSLDELVPEEMRNALGPMAPLMQGLGATLFGAQLGQALAALSNEVLSSTEIGLPLGRVGAAALLPGNLKRYAEGLEGVELEEVRLYAALREAAFHRLYGHVPWLRSHVIGAVEAYASGIHINEEAVESLAGQLDATDPESMRQLDVAALFRPEDSPTQRAALARLEHILALAGGWVNVTTAEAAGERLPGLGKLTEAARRRRGAGGPAEHTFATLVGLQLNPKKTRQAAQLWRKVAEVRGLEARDGLWAHPDLIPSAEDLEEPQAFAERESELGDLDMSIFDQLAVNDPKSDEDSDEDDGPQPAGGSR